MMKSEATQTIDHLLAFSESLKVHFLRQYTNTQFHQFSQKINRTTLQWFLAFLRLSQHKEGSFFSNTNQARLFVARKALELSYPEWSKNGYQAFGATLPVIITTRHYDWLDLLRRSLGLSAESIVYTTNVCSF